MSVPQKKKTTNEMNVKSNKLRGTRLTASRSLYGYNRTFVRPEKSTSVLIKTITFEHFVAIYCYRTPSYTQIF